MTLMKKWMAALALVFLGACSYTQSDDEWEIPDKLKPTYANIYEAELEYNYILLDVFYVYGHSRDEIGESYKDYLGKGTEEVNYVKDGRCTSEFYDVCYMYNQMRDPFTRYFDPYVAQKVWELLEKTDSVIGIGAEVEVVYDSASHYLVVSQVYLNSPAEKAGLKEKDIVVSVDGDPISSVTNFEKMCSGGDEGDLVNLVVARGTDTLDIVIAMGAYLTPSVRLYYQDSVPVIQVKEFVSQSVSDSGTYGEFVAALKKTENAPATIIDLRGNPGGDTKQCINMASELLAKGDTIILQVETIPDSVKQIDGWHYFQAMDTIAYTAIEDGLASGRYFVMLADTGSASCSEMFLAGVSSDKDKGFPIVGQVSYGKGIAQGIWITKNVAGGLALITSMQLFDKYWGSYHDVGFVPDYEIDDTAEQMAKAVELAKGAPVYRTAGYGTRKLGHFSKTHYSNEPKGIPTARDLKIAYKLMSR